MRPGRHRRRVRQERDRRALTFLNHRFIHALQSERMDTRARRPSRAGAADLLLKQKAIFVLNAEVERLAALYVYTDFATTLTASLMKSPHGRPLSAAMISRHLTLRHLGAC